MVRDYFRVVTYVGVILVRGDEVLLMRRQNTGYNDGNYSLPAGHHDGGETLIQAAIREAKEETGVDIKPEDLHLVHVKHKDSPDGERVGFYFACTKWSGEPQNMEPYMCDDLIWRPFTNLPENTVSEIRGVFAAYQRGQLYSDEPIKIQKNR